jgi:hypothetical protein
MSTNTANKLLVLSTGLFPDAETVETAIQQFSNQDMVDRYPIDTEAMDEDAWDDVILRIQQAAIIITL